MIVFSAIIVIAAGGVWYFNRGSNDAPQYQSTVVARGDIVQVVSATGTLNPVTNITVGSQISGHHREVECGLEFAGEGKPSRRAARPRHLSIRRSFGGGRSGQREGEFGIAAGAGESQQRIVHEQIDFRIRLRHGHRQSAPGAGEVQIKEAALTNARVNLQRCTIYSPVDGTVISRAVDVGQTVAASLSAPTLFIIANDLTKMQIDANVSEADIGTVAEGQDVTFTVDAFPDGKFTGRVRQIRNSPTTVQNVVTYDVVIDVSNPELKLRPGMTANASIITAQRSGVLKIPNAAFRFRPPEPSTNATFLPGCLAAVQQKVPQPTLRRSQKPATRTRPKPPPANRRSPAMNRRRNCSGAWVKCGRAARTSRRRFAPSCATITRAARCNGPPAVLAALAVGGGGGFGGRGGGVSGSRGSQPAFRTVYVLADNAPSDADAAGRPRQDRHQRRHFHGNF